MTIIIVQCCHIVPLWVSRIGKIWHCDLSFAPPLPHGFVHFCGGKGGRKGVSRDWARNSTFPAGRGLHPNQNGSRGTTKAPCHTETDPCHWCLAPIDIAHLWKAFNRIRLLMGKFGCTQIQTSNSCSSKRKKDFGNLFFLCSGYSAKRFNWPFGKNGPKPIFGHHRSFAKICFCRFLVS